MGQAWGLRGAGACGSGTHITRCYNTRGAVGGENGAAALEVSRAGTQWHPPVL